MEKNIQEIKDQMIIVKNNQSELADLNSTSKVSIWNLFLFIIAFCFQDLRAYFDAHRIDVTDVILNQKSCTLPWYRIMALEFQHGFDLLIDSDKFDNTDATLEEIDNSKIIKHATATDGDRPGTIIIKVAGEQNDKLVQISDLQKTSIEAYFAEIKGAGDRITIIN